MAGCPITPAWNLVLDRLIINYIETGGANGGTQRVF
jgi:hypothetical protein